MKSWWPNWKPTRTQLSIKTERMSSEIFIQRSSQEGHGSSLWKLQEHTSLCFSISNTHFFNDYTIFLKYSINLYRTTTTISNNLDLIVCWINLRSKKALLVPEVSNATYCVLPVSPEVFEPSLQVIEQVDLLAALGAVDVHELAGVLVTYLPRGLTRTANTNT